MKGVEDKSLEAAARAVNLVSQNGDAVYSDIARAAIEAYLSAERARGFQMMPREPTEAMIVSGIAERHGQPVPEAWALATQNIWTAMWDAWGGPP